MRGSTPLFGSPGIDVGRDRCLHRAEVVAVVEHAGLHAVPLLAVGLCRFAPDVVFHAGCRHQVALVGASMNIFPA